MNVLVSERLPSRDLMHRFHLAKRLLTIFLPDEAANYAHQREVTRLNYIGTAINSCPYFVTDPDNIDPTQHIYLTRQQFESVVRGAETLLSESGIDHSWFGATEPQALGVTSDTTELSLPSPREPGPLETHLTLVSDTPSAA